MHHPKRLQTNTQTVLFLSEKRGLMVAHILKMFLGFSFKSRIVLHLAQNPCEVHYLKYQLKIEQDYALLKQRN